MRPINKVFYEEIVQAIKTKFAEMQAGSGFHEMNILSGLALSGVEGSKENPERSRRIGISTERSRSAERWA